MPECLTLSRRLIVACLSVLVLGAGLAQDSIEREGYFEVRSATTEVVAGVHTLDARLQLVLSSEALAALESGVTLTIEAQLQVIRSRRFSERDTAAKKYSFTWSYGYSFKNE